ncbi:MAG: hypothetical protein H7Y88_12955 [Phycisphaerales bacterium]|nr:hypothetical protein [Phycisphaerales bacterium]
MKHYTYDGFGRLIRTPSPSPWPEPDVEATDIRSERFYYTASGASRKYCL